MTQIVTEDGGLPEWPSAEGDGEEPSSYEKQRRRRKIFDAQLAEISLQRNSWSERDGSSTTRPAPPGLVESAKALSEADSELYVEYHKAITKTATESISRARQGMEFVERAAAAILAIYTGILALAFSVGDRPLPPHGILPGVFLGLAIAFAATYLGFVKAAHQPAARRTSNFTKENQDHRTAHYVRWVTAAVENKQFAARASVLSLFVGTAFLPAAFLSFTTEADVAIAEAEVEMLENELEISSAPPELSSVDASDLDALRLAQYGTLVATHEASLATLRVELETARANVAGLQARESLSASWFNRKTIWWLAVFGLIVVLVIPAGMSFSQRKDQT